MCSRVAQAAKILKPLNCFEGSGIRSYALIYLNLPIRSDLLNKLWKNAVFRASVDGAANHLRQDPSLKDCVPDLLSGDFDSISAENLQHYRDIGCKVVETEDQDETDFTKSLRLVLNHLDSNKTEVEYIVALGAIGCRFDHTIANVNTLYKAAKLTSIPVYLIGQESLACLLTTGKHKIEVNTGFEAEWCGLFPIGKPCQNVTTTGLKWNLNNQKLEFGSLISTSNTYTKEQNHVTVETDQPLLWSMGIKMAF